MNFWQKVEVGIVFIFFIEGAQPLPLYSVLPWGVSDGVGEGWGISAGEGGRGLGRGSGGFAGREKEGGQGETGDPLSRYIQEKSIFARFNLFSNAMEGT